MDSQLEKYLWKELEILQSIIDKFDDFTFRIKNWFITIFIGISGYSILQAKPVLLWLNIFLVIIFYFYEVSYRTAHAAFLKRSREIQTLLRTKAEIKEMDTPPYFDRYLFESVKIDENSRFLSFMLKIGFEEKRARKTVVQTITILKESLKMIFQFRISIIYIFALVITLLISFIATP